MYIVHHILSVVDEVMKPANQTALMTMGVMTRWKEYLPKFERILNDAELYAFDKSALIPAGDVRIHENRGLMAIAEHVTRSSRKLFLESDTRELSDAMPEFLAPVPSEAELKKNAELWDGYAIRRGCMMEMAGDGKCSMQSVSLTKMGPSKAIMRKRGLTGKQARFMSDFMRVSLSVLVADIDTTLEPDVSFQEFVANQDQDLSKRGIDAAWLQKQMEGRFLARVDQSMPIMAKMSLSQSPFEVWLQELHGIFFSSFAMTAVLELKDAKQTSRAVVLPRSDANGRRRKQQDTPETEMSLRKRTISVVTMRLTDDLLISPRKEAKAVDSPSSQKSGSPRALHHVRGHMFLARNGKIVYRKPHFRGQAGLRTLNRVVS
jgi:hypothetical protein